MTEFVEDHPVSSLKVLVCEVVDDRICSGMKMGQQQYIQVYLHKTNNNSMSGFIYYLNIIDHIFNDNLPHLIRY